MKLVFSIVPAILLCALMSSVQASEYHVSPSGLDSNSGTASRPFRTISKAALVMKPGDTCVVHGGVYRETIRPQSSGTPKKPLRFVTAKNESVIVTGTERAINWVRDRGNIYKTKVDFPFNQLFVDGRMMNQARWPNTGLDPLHPHLATAKSGSEGGKIVDSALNPPEGTWEGATVHLTPGSHWVSWTKRIKASSAADHYITFDPCGKDSAYAVMPGTRYYITNTLAALDVPGEWHQTEDGNLYLYSPDGRNPELHRVEVKKRNLAFDLSKRSYINLCGFRIFASSINLSDANNCVVENCHIQYVSHFVECDGWGTGMDDSGVVISGHDNVLRGCSIVYSAGNGVSLLGERNTVDNCLIHDVDYAAVDCGAIRAIGKNHAILHNTLYNSGRSVLVHRYLKHSRIAYNNMYNAGLLTSDLGITYCFDTDGEMTTIDHNWVHDNYCETGVGIYIDNNSSNHIIHHNVSWNNSNSGIRLNTPCHNAICFNNTLISNGDSLNYWGANDNRDQAGCQFFNNIATDKVIAGDGIEVTHNYTGKVPMLLAPEKCDFRLDGKSPCIGAGISAREYNQNSEGTADLGAYEFGKKPWKAGHDWGLPPDFEP